MPELPEVETIATDLNKNIKGKKIARVWYDWPKMIHLVSAPVRRNLAHHPKSKKDFERDLIGRKITSVTRRQKNVMINLSEDKILAVHPKMTGHFLFGKWVLDGSRPVPMSAGAIQEKVNSYIHFLIWFSDGSMLGFSDARKFGRILFGSRDGVMNSKELSELGPEPLSTDFTLALFCELVRGSRGKAKQFLLNQSKIAGIGNIYADETLWASRVHPQRRMETLRPGEVRTIYKNIRKILTSAVKLRGTSMSDYRDASGQSGGYMAQIKVYGKEGEPCPRCGTNIKRIVIGARSAHFCPHCQK